MPPAWPKGQSSSLFGSDRAAIYGSFQTELGGSQFMKTSKKHCSRAELHQHCQNAEVQAGMNT